ncbi:MAG TPA: hypothetical protein V6D03_02945, partial [Candidatus Caenarcaniphilales bacterium]
MAKVALLVGVSDCGGPSLGLLPGPPRNLEVLQQTLLRSQLGAFTAVDTLLNPDPLRLQQAIEVLFGNPRAADLVLLYFCGHALHDEQGKLYLATGITGKNPQTKLLKSATVSVSFIYDAMSSSSVNQQIVILDCWFSGALVTGGLHEAANSVDQQQLGRHRQVVLTAATSAP